MKHLMRMALVVLAAWGGLGMAEARVDGEYLAKVRPERFVTPCRPFAADYAKGPLKVLFLSNLYEAPREIVELKQRFRMDIDATLFVHRNKQLGADDVYTGAVLGTSRAERLAVLYEQLSQPWDAIVVGANIPFNDLSPRAQYLIFKQVSDGAGLVALSELRKQPVGTPYEEDPAQILAGVPFPLLKSYAGLTKVPLDKIPGDVLKTYTLGKGRIALYKHYQAPYGATLEGYWLGYHSLTPAFPYTYKEDVYYDYYLSAIAKTLLWAVPSKGSAIAADAANPGAGEIAWSDLPGTVSAGVFNIPAGTATECKAELRDLFGKVTPLSAPAVKAGAYELTVKLPALPRGDYFVDYRFVSTKGTEYWGSYGVTVTGTAPGIAEIRPDEERFPWGEPFRASVRLTEPPRAAMTLRASGFDRAGREVFRVSVPVRREEVNVKAELDHCVSMAHYVRCELWEGERCLDVARENFLVGLAQDPIWPNIIWGGSGGTILGEIQTDQIRKAGFNVSLGHDPHRAATRDQLEINYLIALRFPAVTDKDPDPGFNNPQWTADYVAKSITAPVEKMKKWGVWYYSLGDENSYAYDRQKVAPSEMRAWHAYLQEVYKGDLNLLNKEWGKEYGSFEEIPWINVQLPLQPADIPAKNLWMSFCEKQYADAHHAMAAAIRESDPGARVGAEGSLAGNLEETLKGLQLWGPYPSRLDNALMRSFETEPLLKGNWWGGYVAGRSAKAQPIWDQILTGGVNSNYYYAIEGSEGFMSADMSYADYFEKDQLGAIKVISDVVGPVINKTPVAKMGLGLFYSLPSEHAGTIDTDWGAVGSCRDGLLRFSEQTGISSFFYSEKQILGGKLRLDQVKVLVLPQAICMSDAVAQALEVWVAGGGVLIADQHCALRNERGAAREKGALDDLFGVQQTLTGVPQSVTVDGTLLGVPVKWERVIVDAGLKTATKGQVGLMLDGKMPLVNVRQVGQGKAIFLNLSLGKLLANYAGDAATRKFMLALLGPAGIYTGLEAPNGCLVTRFAGEGYELLSCRMTSEAKPGEALKLGKKQHVYDVIQGEYLGEVSEIVLSEAAGRNRLFTLLPARASEFAVQTAGTVPAGEMMTVTVSARAPVGQCNPDRRYRLRIFGPDNAEIEPLHAYADGGATPASFRVPLAYNMAPGAYRCEVTDLLTGMAKTVRFTIAGGGH